MIQDIHEESVLQRYPIGQRYVIDNRVFHYFKAVHAIDNVGTYRLAVATDQVLAISDLLTVAPAAVVGDKQVKVAVGTFQAGVVAKDEFVNGYLEMWPVAGGNQFMHRRIVGNSAVSGGEFTIDLDKPLNFAVGVGSQVTIHPSIYRAVKSAGDAGLAGYQVAVGLPSIPVTINYFAWMQTWGPCFVAPTGTWPLGAANFIDVYMHSDGCINSSLGEVIGTTVSPQRVGHVIGAGNYGCAEIMLELDP